MRAFEAAATLATVICVLLAVKRSTWQYPIGIVGTAQFLLDRKKLETWPVWALVNALSVYTYGTQHLWLTTALYAALLVNTVWGYWEWRPRRRRGAGAILQTVR